MYIEKYKASLQSEFNTGQSTEHSFRSALKTLLESLNQNILALNESQRIVGVGMPDFTIKDIKNNTINIWWIEAKDLYIDLDEKKNTDQLGRYLAAFDNFVYTNNLQFNFYRIHFNSIQSYLIQFNAIQPNSSQANPIQPNHI